MKVNKKRLKGISETIEAIRVDLEKGGTDTSKLKDALGKLNTMIEKENGKLTSDERVAKIVDILLATNGSKSTKELADELGVSSITIGRDLKKAAGEVPTGKALESVHAGHNLKAWQIVSEEEPETDESQPDLPMSEDTEQETEVETEQSEAEPTAAE